MEEQERITIQEIYLDNNATTRIDPEVAKTILDVGLSATANPASQHRSGRRARQVLELARESICKSLGCRLSGMSADQLIFTSGGTESNNLAIFGLQNSSVDSSLKSSPETGLTLVSSIEHPSVLGAAQALREQGGKVDFCRVKCDGELDLNDFDRFMERHDYAMKDANNSSRIRLVSIMFANNETGVMQPLQHVVDACRSRGILVHTDAVQVLGKIPMSFEKLGVDAMTVTAHKLHGPVGIGAIVLRAGLIPKPQLYGGFQQLGWRPGTECVALAAGFAKAVELAVENVAQRSQYMMSLREAFEKRLAQSKNPPTILGSQSQRLPHTTSAAFRGLDRQSLQMAIDFAGIACSTGSACASGSGQPSHVLQAMGIEDELVRGAIRFSFSHENSPEEIDRAAETIQNVVERLTVNLHHF